MASKTVATKPRLLEFYKNDVVKSLIESQGYKNVNEVPKVEKIVLNMGLGDVKDNTKSFNLAVEELEAITGQKPLVTHAKKSISNFKLRENQKIGAKVTLRGVIMYEFLDRFISIILPRVRDFNGLSDKSFDSRGNYNLGVKDQLIFPEISYEKIEKIRGLDICFVTTAKTDKEAKALLIAMGMPFIK
ncbi:MAG: 50S ribosomal protein L5 [Bacilli bacterium]